MNSTSMFGKRSELRAKKKKGKELTVVHTFAVQPSQLKEVRQAAFDSDMSISKYICNAIREYAVGYRNMSDNGA